MPNKPGEPPPYLIEVLPKAVREIEHLPGAARRSVVSAIDGLAADPRPVGCEQLTGTGRERILRIRVGDYRILYQVYDARLVVLVVRVADRREAYDRTAMKRLIGRIRATR